jgi:hypothetical protein
MNYETGMALVFITAFNMVFTLWWTTDSAVTTIAQQHRAEQFLIEGMWCVETSLITAGANEYAKVFDCEN